jgi:methionyl-tRNA formyltransferase
VNVLLVAEESAGIQVLRALVRGPHRLVAALTAAPTRGGGATVASAAETAGVPVLESQRVSDPGLAHWIREQEVDLLLNVHSLYLIDTDVLAAPSIGSFNLHPGPLPAYAGLNAPSWAIYRGEKTHAVTLHWMEPEIDTGAIAYSAALEITDDDTGLSLSAKCVREGVPLIETLLETASNDRAAIPAVPQDLSKRRYFRRDAVPNDGKVVWSTPARRLVDFVRACDYFPFPSPWGHPTARLGGRPLLVLKASATGERTDAEPGTVGAASGGAIAVAASDEWLLVHRVRLDGSAREAAEVLEPGLRLGDG